MKLFISSLIAAGLSAVSAQTAVLTARWQLEEPSVTYDSSANTFAFGYTTASVSNDQMRVAMYDINCAADGTNTYTAYPIPSSSYTASTPSVSSGYPTWDLSLAVQLLANDVNIYKVIDGSESYVDDGTSGVVAADVGSGLMSMCARFDIGYLESNGDFKSVNFIETLIRIKYDLTAGFDVAGFSVAPKERVTTTAARDQYELTAYVCQPGTTGADGFPIPAVDGSSEENAFRQGALVSVCVRPDTTALDDGITVASITDYTWKREAPVVIEQPAVVGSEDSLNSLTVHGCEGTYCTIESILFAEFYASTGSVTGTGNAQLAFSRRQLSADGQERRLEEEDAVSTFDVSVGVQAGAEGPGALKTASGASMGVIFASFIALASAALLA